MNDYPKVSICIPTYNRCDYLKKTIESALAQDYLNLEVIVSDNASTDNTLEEVKQFGSDQRFSYHRNQVNVGMVANWRTLLYELVSGDWFIVLSDDDYLVDPAYVSKAINLSRKDYGINLVYANGYIFYTDRKEKIELKIPYKEIENGTNIFFRKHMVTPQEFTLCNIMFKTELAKKLGAFSNLDNLCCDSELFLKICLLGKVGIVKDFVSVYRYHDSNLINKKRTYRELIAVTDIFLETYKFAKVDGKVDEKELKKWRAQVLDPAMKNILFSLSADYPENFKEAMNILSKKSEYNLNVYFWDPVYTLKILATKNKWVYEKLRSIKKYLVNKA